MASLSFNSAPTRTPNHTSPTLTSLPTKPITSSTSHGRIPYPHLSHFSTNKPKLVLFSQLSETPTSSSPPSVEGVEDLEFEDDPTAELSYLDPEIDPESIYEWELDFCSRPILDIRGKKLWELVVCDNSLSLQYTKYFPNNVINSITLKDAMVSICDELGLPLPEKVRFFRTQMQTIITKACQELGIKPVPSKRCLSLILWLEERYETVYMRHPFFKEGSKPLLALDNPFPMELPENLVGEKWAFVQLPFAAVQEEVLSLETKFAFGASLDLELLGIDIDEKTLIPGLAVATSRAKPLSAWMNGLEVCSVEADIAKNALILGVGISTRYVYATYRKTPAAEQEAENWEAAKKACGGLHFLAIQEDLDSDDCVGFWLLLDLPPPPV